MNWMINLVCCVGITSLTGGIMFLLWQCFTKLLKQHDFSKLMNGLLRFLSITFLFPLAYGILFLGVEAFQSWQGKLFLPTPTLLMIGRILFAIWVLGMVVMAILLGLQVRRRGLLFYGKFDTEADVQQIFSQVQKELPKKTEKVQLYYSYGVATPLLCGWLHPVILLPVKEYSQDQLRIIFRHELQHYLHGDILWKYIANAVRVIHWFSPLAWWYGNTLDLWTEYACDLAICQDSPKEIKHYFSVICAMKAENSGKISLGVAHLLGKSSDLKKRLEMVIHHRESKSTKSAGNLLVLVLILFLSVAGIGASCYGFTQVYLYFYNDTQVSQEGGNPGNWGFDGPNTEVLDASFPAVEGGFKESSKADSGHAFSWEISQEEWMVSQPLALSKGDVLSLYANVLNNEAAVKVGIVAENGQCRFIFLSSYGQQEFFIEETGEIRLYVHNESGSDVQVVGHFIIH